jgi:hypothetical protein
METKTIDYTVKVLEVTEGGHPIQKITNNFKDASEIYDLLRKQYPNKEIQIWHTTQKVIVKGVPAALPPSGEIPKELNCPRGHSGTIDGKNVIVRTSDGTANSETAYCSICLEFLTFEPQPQQ